MHVGDAGLPVEDPGALQLDVLGTEVVKETAPLAEEHRMRWISSSSRTPAASPSCAVPAPWTSTFLSPAARLASNIAVLTSFTYVTSGHFPMSLSGSRRLRTQIGTPSWWSPPQPPAGSKVPRPATTAPVAIARGDDSVPELAIDLGCDLA